MNRLARDSQLPFLVTDGEGGRRKTVSSLRTTCARVSPFSYNRKYKANPAESINGNLCETFQEGKVPREVLQSTSRSEEKQQALARKTPVAVMNRGDEGDSVD